MADNLQFRHMVKRCANLWFVWKNRELLESSSLSFRLCVSLSELHDHRNLNTIRQWTKTELHVESKIAIDRSHQNGWNRIVYYPMETWD